MEPLFFSILGAPACGKSYLLASMTWQLRKNLPRDFALSLADADTVSNQSLNEYEEILFLNPEPDRLVAIRKTELQGELYDTVDYGDHSVSYPRPFVFSLKPQEQHPNYHSLNKLSRAVCMYDNAGEHFLPGADTAGTPVTRHLALSHALFFLFDPTQDPRFRAKCQGETSDPQMAGKGKTARQETILHEAAERIRRHTGLSQSEKHSRPLMVLVTKYDTWSSLLRPDGLPSPIMSRRRDGKRALDVPKIEDVSAELRSLLLEHSPEIVSAAEGFAKEVIYLPVSALGCSPEQDPESDALLVRPRDIAPIWAEVPILYALCRWLRGMVPFRQRSQKKNKSGGAGTAASGQFVARLRISNDTASVEDTNPGRPRDAS